MIQHRIFRQLLPLSGVIFIFFSSCNAHLFPLYQKAPPPHTALEQLGRYLFFDPRLSATGTKSCSSCHDPNLAFSDGYRRSPGIYADPATRNAPSLINTAHLRALNWANPNITTFQAQMIHPLFSDTPSEMGLQSNADYPLPYLITDHVGMPFDAVLKRLQNDSIYIQLFKESWNTPPEKWTQNQVIEAISAYEKTLISYNSPYDAWLKGDKTALSPDAEAGRQLFFSRRLGCGKCHSGVLLTDGKMYNIGLYHLNSQGAYPTEDQGLFEETHQDTDRGKFRTPSLRNVTLTKPYFHDGSIADISQVIRIFANGGQVITNGPLAGDGRKNPHKSEWVQPFILQAEEERQILLFLESLTDSTIVTNNWFQNPFTF